VSWVAKRAFGTIHFSLQISLSFCVTEPENGQKNTAAKQLPFWLRPAVAISMKVTQSGVRNPGASAPRPVSPDIQFTR
jgi:hypothetical protein